MCRFRNAMARRVDYTSIHNVAIYRLDNAWFWLWVVDWFLHVGRHTLGRLFQIVRLPKSVDCRRGLRSFHIGKLQWNIETALPAQCHNLLQIVDGF